MINTLVMSGSILHLEVNTKKAAKGPAAIIMVQYGEARERTDQAVQFPNVAVMRVPPYIYERCKDDLKVGVTVDIVGQLQGVWKQSPLGEGYLSNEAVVNRIQVIGAASASAGETSPAAMGLPTEDEPAAPAAGVPA